MEAEEESPVKKGGQARRPMNAFLIFCKRHRSLVREKNPHLDNRSVTRILGELWAKLSLDEKASYTSLANEYKEAFMKANPDYKWFNTDKSHPVRNDKPSTRPTNSLVAYHGEVPRSESHENNNHGQYQHGAQPPSTHSNFRPPVTAMPHPGAMPRSTVPTMPQPGNGIMDLSKRPPANNIDGQQVSMAMELMKCVSQANSYSGLPQATGAVSVATPNTKPVVKETKSNSKDYGNVSLLHLAKMCSDELESNKQGVKAPEVQSSMLTPPWTPQYDQTYSPPRVETTTAESQGKERKDKENLPNNMQDEKMTLKEFKQQQQNGAATKEHFKNLILSTESDVTTCGKLVVDRVIESIYSQEFGTIEQKPGAGPKTTNTASSTYTPQQQNQNGAKPGDRLSSLFGVNNAQVLNQNAGTFKNESSDVKEGGKMTLTFGQIQESLIRKAVENSYEFDIVSGLKSENIAFLQDSKDKIKKEKSDYSVFDFSNSDVGQNLVEMSSFESRIKSKKYEQTKGAFSSGNGNIIANQAKPITVQAGMVSPYSAVASNANKPTASSQTNGASQVTSYPGAVPPKGELQYQNRTAMELLQKCDELSRINDSKFRPNVPSTKPNRWKPSGSAINLTNQPPANVSPAASQKSPPVPLKKRKFHLPIEPTTVEERPVYVVNKRHERTISVDSLNQDENSNDSTETRKSKRSNRGQRYKALMKQGVLQGSREKVRKNSNGSEVGTPTTEEAPTPLNTLPCLQSTSAQPVQTTSALPVSRDNAHIPRPIRKRTYSEVNTTFTTPSRVRRYTTGDFDLDAHIASLPVVDIDGVGRKNVPRPKPKPKIRHHSESSVLSPNQTSHCAPVTSQSHMLLQAMTSLSPNSGKNKDKMINVAELRKVIRQRTSSECSDIVRERSNSTSSQSGSAAKRKARKRAITHLIPVSSQAGYSAGEASDPKKKTASPSTAATPTSCNGPNAALSSAKGGNRHVLTCP